MSRLHPKCRLLLTGNGQSGRRNRFCKRSRRGSASALIVLMLVLLIFFGVLSVVTAAADNRLASRRAEWVRTYYETDRKAVETVGDLNNYASMSPSAQAANRGDLIELMLTHLGGLPGIELLEADLMAGEDFLFRVWNGEQAIEVGLKLSEPMPAGAPFRLDITRWSAWQKPFEEENAGGVWKGELT